MKKEKKEFFEDVAVDDIATAQSIIEKSEANIAKAKRGMLVGVISLAFMLVAMSMKATSDFTLTVRNIVCIFWFVTALMTIILGGGFSKALSIGFKLARTVWYIVPFILWDIVFAFVAGMFVIFGYLFVPIIFVWLFRIQSEKDLAIAKEYLKQK